MVNIKLKLSAFEFNPYTEMLRDVQSDLELLLEIKNFMYERQPLREGRGVGP